MSQHHQPKPQSSEIGQDLREDTYRAQNDKSTPEARRTVEDHEHVRLDGIDGRRWHVVDSVELDGEKDVLDVLVTRCGRKSPRYKSEISPIGETPSGLSGRTICYDCGRIERGTDR